MDKILIHGGVPLTGTIKIGGAKNAALPLMAASLLTADPLILANVPDLADLATMANLLVQRGAEIVFPGVSVGATENLLMAATLAEGETLLINAAREPEITDLAHCLTAMGAQIDGIGSDRLAIRGVASLHGARHTVIPDRIETGTYMMAVAATGGEVRLLGARLDHGESVRRILDGAE